MCSFLSERSLCVVHRPSRSSWVPASYGHPGDFVGPIPYIIYTSETGSLLAATSVFGNLCADDIQAYMHCIASSVTAAVLSVLETWMSTNCLRLNPSKTQFIGVVIQQQLAKLDLVPIAANFPISYF